MDRRQFCRVTGNRNMSGGRPACSLFAVGCGFMSPVQGSNSRLSEKYFYLKRMILLGTPRHVWKEILN
jgi:hypothetical protein